MGKAVSEWKAERTLGPIFVVSNGSVPMIVFMMLSSNSPTCELADAAAEVMNDGPNRNWCGRSLSEWLSGCERGGSCEYLDGQGNSIMFGVGEWVEAEAGAEKSFSVHCTGKEIEQGEALEREFLTRIGLGEIAEEP